MGSAFRLLHHQYRQLGIGLLVLAALSSCNEKSKKTVRDDRPNILLIFPDQLRSDALACMGNPDVKTPYLDELARSGALLANTYSNTPVCCPARATIFTGKYAHSNGMITNDLRLADEQTTIAEILKNEGYDTGFIGKWHLDGGPKLPGFVPPERRQGFDFWAANICDHNHYDSQYFKGNDTVPIPIDRFEPEVWVDEALAFIEKERNTPFFLTVAPGPPHNPYKAPGEYRAMYDPSRLKMPDNWQAGVKNGSKEDLANYYGMISALDTQMGRLLQHLEATDQRENTIVLFVSDHGDMLGSQGRIFKRQPWEESAKVPGILSWPKKIPKHKKVEALFSTVDILPTLLDLSHVNVPNDIQGVSIKESILGNDMGQQSIYLEILGPCNWQGVTSGWRGIRTARYKYARYEDKPWVMYDLLGDPHEMDNLVGLPDYDQLQSQLDSLLHKKMAEINDSWELNWSYPFADNWELQKHFAFTTIDDFFEWKERNLYKP